MSEGPTIGIDLGTSNSCVAAVVDENLESLGVTDAFVKRFRLVGQTARFVHAKHLIILAGHQERRFRTRGANQVYIINSLRVTPPLMGLGTTGVALRDVGA